MISVCGLKCKECEFFGNACQGCRKVEGKPFWVEHIEQDTCPIYKCCCNEKSYHDCGSCSALPCKTYFELKDPALSDEEHLEYIKTRTEILKNKQ